MAIAVVASWPLAAVTVVTPVTDCSTMTIHAYAPPSASFTTTPLGAAASGQALSIPSRGTGPYDVARLTYASFDDQPRSTTVTISCVGSDGTTASSLTGPPGARPVRYSTYLRSADGSATVHFPPSGTAAHVFSNAAAPGSFVQDTWVLGIDVPPQALDGATAGVPYRTTFVITQAPL